MNSLDRVDTIEKHADDLVDRLQVRTLHARSHWYILISLDGEPTAEDKYLRLDMYRPNGEMVRLTKPASIATALRVAKRYGIHTCSLDDWQDCPDGELLDEMITDPEVLNARFLWLESTLRNRAAKFNEKGDDPKNDPECQRLAKRMQALRELLHEPDRD